MIKWSTEVLKETPRRAISEKEEGVVFGTDITVSKSASKHNIYFVRVRIGSKLAQKAGIKTGDKVALGWDEVTRLGYIRVVSSDDVTGHKLSGLKREKASGGPEPLQLRYTWKQGQPSVAKPKLCREVVVLSDSDPDRIQFVYPEGTSFDELADMKANLGNGDGSKVIQYNRRSTDRQAMSN